MKLKDDIFCQCLQSSLNDMRMSGFLCDVIIVIGDREFTAHKSVLSAASLYFRAMFNLKGTFKESKENKITLHGVDSDAVSTILQFIYTSNIEITEKNVYLLMETSNLLQISALKAYISHYLEITITTYNCLSSYIMATLHNYLDLAHSAFRFILQNFSEVAERDEFLEIPVNVLLEILSSKFLNVACESSLLKHLLRWINADVENRKNYGAELFDKIEFTNIAIEELIKLKDDPIFETSLKNKIEHIHNEQFARRYQIKAENWETLRYGSEQGVILAIGGESSGKASRTVECFTLGYDSWKCVIPQYIHSSKGPQNTAVIPAMRCARYNAGVAHDCYNVYVFGGRSSVTYLDECETYNIKENKWKSLKNMPCKLEGSGAVIYEGRLIITGGQNEYGSTRQAWELDEKNDSWRDFPSLKSPRSFHGTVAVKGYIFAIGGLDRGSCVSLMTGERYDPNLNKWFEIRSMHEARARFGCAVIDKYIYVIGGINGGWGLKSVEKYDLETNEWSYVAPMSVPRFSFSVAINDKKIYCIGGNDTVHCLHGVDKFNPCTNRWHFVPSMQVCRLGLVSATLLVPYIKGSLGS